MECIKDTMKNTKTESKMKKANTEKEKDEKILCSVSEKSLEDSQKVSILPRNYLRDAAEHLIVSMDKVSKEKNSKESIQAMCQIASQIANVCRVNLEMKKNGF